MYFSSMLLSDASKCERELTIELTLFKGELNNVTSSVNIIKNSAKF